MKAIYHLSKHGNVSVSTNAIAKKMNTKPSSVTDMIQKLADKSLVDYKKYQGADLTEKGRLAATSVIRKHRLWEVFLVNELNFSWDEVHEVAEQLEHIKSEKLINQLDKYLEFPTKDPHGDPIPDKFGNIKKTEKILLSHTNVKQHCICVGVKDSSSSFLKYLDKNKIALGTHIKVLSIESFDESMDLQVDAEILTISKEVANNLFVKTI